MGKTTEQIAEETREIRLQMLKLMEVGLTEQEALQKCTPGDSNRARKLKRWKKLGLWPVPEEELTEGQQGEADPEAVEPSPATEDNAKITQNDQVTEPVSPPPPPRPTQPLSYDPTEMSLGFETTYGDPGYDQESPPTADDPDKLRAWLQQRGIPVLSEEEVAEAYGPKESDANAVSTADDAEARSSDKGSPEGTITEQPTELDAKITGTTTEEEVDDLASRRERKRKLKMAPETDEPDWGLVEMQILEGLLSAADVEDREWYGPGTGKAPESKKLQQLGGRFPPDLVKMFKDMQAQLGGRTTHHMERALKIYLEMLIRTGRFKLKE